MYPGIRSPPLKYNGVDCSEADTRLRGRGGIVKYTSEFYQDEGDLRSRIEKKTRGK